MNIFEAHHDQLVQGGEIDSRKRTSGADAALERLANSIHQRGLLQPIVIRQPTPGGLYQIIAGNRRHAAIGLLIERGQWGKFQDIRVFLRETDDATSFEDSIAENIERRALHPVEQYEAFALAQSNGATVAELASRFGIPTRIVEQRLSLGNLAPAIRDGLFMGEIAENAANLFCMLPDWTAQGALYERLKRAKSLNHWQVRNALQAGNAAKAFGLITVDDYVARGGTLTEDLFGNDHIVSDPELAATMAREVMLKECASLKDEGWSFALLREEVSNSYNWRDAKKEAEPTPDEAAERDRLAARAAEIETVIEGEQDGDQREATDEEEAELEDANRRIEEIEAALSARAVWTPELKARTGCFVSQDRQTGALVIERGKIDPTAKTVDVATHTRGAPAKGTADQGGGEPEAKAGISDALALALSEQRTRATAATLEEHPHIALAAAVFALSNPFAYGPAKITAAGIDGRSQGAAKGEGPTMAELVAMKPAPLLKLFAKQVAASLDMRIQSQTSASLSYFDDLIRALPGDHYESNAKKLFDAPMYFDRIKGSMRDEALREMDREPLKGKKAESVAACLYAQSANYWLPPQLRFPDDETEA